MTREQIEKLPVIIAIMLSGSVTVDVKENIHKQLTEVCNLAIKALEQKPSVLQDIKSELWMEGMNMAGEYQGVWVRYRDIERVIDKHISER